MSNSVANLSRRGLIAACGLGFASLSIPKTANALPDNIIDDFEAASFSETGSGYIFRFPNTETSCEIEYNQLGFDLYLNDKLYVQLEKNDDEFYINGELASWKSQIIQPKSVPGGFTYVTTVYSGAIQNYAALVGIIVGIVMYNPAWGYVVAKEILDLTEHFPIYLATDYYKNYSTNQNYIVLKFYRDQYMSLIKSYEYGPYS